MEHVATPERVLALAAASGLSDRPEIDFGGDRAAYERFVDTLDALAWLNPATARRVDRGRGTTPWETFMVAGVRIASPMGCTHVSDMKDAEPIARLSRLRI